MKESKIPTPGVGYVGYRAKKYLGQNFLKSETVLKKMIEAGEISREDTILEIGPGKGALTKKLLENAGRVVTVEKDIELFEFLKNKFENQISSGYLVLAHGDILDFDMPKVPFDIGKKYKLIANIPYNITGAILKKFLTDENQPERMVLMVQKEVAQRIIAREGRESILSVSVKAYGEPKMLMKVPARYFSPAPEVDSAIILIKNISRKFFKENKINESRFWELVRAGFAHKRKKVASNLKNLVSKTAFDALGNKRAEELTLADWTGLVRMLQ